MEQHLEFRPVTAAEWDDLAAFFVTQPACSMCWCMYWRKTRAEAPWSITCFAVSKELRRRGVTAALIEQAVSYADRMGARVVEAYPYKNADTRYKTPGEAFMGFASTFHRLGFVEASDRSKTRNIMRLYLKTPTEHAHTTQSWHSGDVS